jgi:glycosyltransferase involved in cell wall biosynthesis
MHYIDFSVIIPSYENLSLFKRAYHSVKKQQDVNCEIIIVDDSVHDGIERYINQLHDDKILYYHNKPSLGAVKNWNYGLSLATGKYVLVLHHDEELTDGLHLKKCLDKLSKGYDVVVSNIKVIFKDNKVRYGLCPNLIKHFSLKCAIPLFIGPTACVIFNRNILQFFDEKLCWLVDIEWYYRILKSSRAYYNKNLYVSSSHGHDGQITFQINIKENEKNDLRKIHKKYRKNIRMHIILIFIYMKRVVKKIM